MNYARIALAALGGMVGYLVAGTAVFILAPQMATEFEKYSVIYRSREGQAAAMPAGMAAMLVAIVVVAALYAMAHQRGSGLRQGVRFGALIGLFVVCAFVMHNYMLAMFILVSQTAACNRRHPVEERCARWLLMTHDRVASDHFPMTHEFLADMLGVRRPSVSIAMGMLSRAGFTRYKRGKVEVMDRKGLESAACECYRVVGESYERTMEMECADGVRTV